MSRTPRKRPGQDKTLSPNVEGLQVGDTDSGTSKARTSGRARAGTEERPRYQQMVRSEARLRPDQVDELAKLRRRVSTDRDDKSERITDNTLLRVAVDLLLSQEDQLAGDTEDSLRKSVIHKQTE